MATSLARQLATIAASSTNQLDLKAQRRAHSESLLFEPSTASAQDFDTLYQICSSGFDDLCRIDSRFSQFSRTIFGIQSKDEERSQMTATQNEELDVVLESFIRMSSKYLLLKPAQKAVEWIIRRFRVHQINTIAIVLAFLPHHRAPIFVRLLAILPKNLPHTLGFLKPYAESLASPSKQAIVQGATRSTELVTLWSDYVLKACQNRCDYAEMISQWAYSTTESLVTRLDQNTAGRRELRRQKEEEILLWILPILNQGLGLKNSNDARIGCFMILTVLVSKTDLTDEVISALMEAVVLHHKVETSHAELICLTVLAKQRRSPNLPRKVLRTLLSMEGIYDDLAILSQKYETENLAFSLLIGILEKTPITEDASQIRHAERLLTGGIITGSKLSEAISRVLKTANEADFTPERGGNSQTALAEMISSLVASERVGHVTRDALLASGIDQAQLEMKLLTSLNLNDNEELPDAKPTEEEAKIDTFESLKASIPTKTAYEVSFLSPSKSYIFPSLLKLFGLASQSESNRREFLNLPLLTRNLAVDEPLFISFFLRVLCGPYNAAIRTLAITSLSDYFENAQVACDPQVLLPYIVYGLADPSPNVRRAATGLLLRVHETYQKLQSSGKVEKHSVMGKESLYGTGSLSVELEWLRREEASGIVESTFLPSIEEFKLDPARISQVISHALTAEKQQKGLEGLAKLLKASERALFLHFLGSHVICSPLLRFKERLLSVLTDVEKAGNGSKVKSLAVLLDEFQNMDEAKLQEAFVEESVSREAFTFNLMTLISPRDRESMKRLESALSSLVSLPATIRKAYLERIKSIWPFMKLQNQLSLAQALMDNAVQPLKPTLPEDFPADCLETLRNLSFTSEALHSILLTLPSLTEGRPTSPNANKRRRTSFGHVDGTATEDDMKTKLRRISISLELCESSKGGQSVSLFQPLFSLLSQMCLLEDKSSGDLSYCQVLALSCLYDVSERARKSTQKIDPQSIRADVVVDSFKSATSSQLQHGALMLLSSLATTVPDRIIHSVMPIFTSMGSSMLRQHDDYTAHVIDKTIESVVPPLIAALRKEKKGSLAGASELLLCFVAAFEHIPRQRRVPLFSSLVEKLGKDEFLFVLLAVLVDRHGATQTVASFIAELTDKYEPTIILKATANCLELVKDSLSDNPTSSNQILSTEDDKFAENLRPSLISMLAQLLSKTKLKEQVSSMIAADEGASRSARQLLASLVESTIELGADNVAQKTLSAALNSLLDALLHLLSLEDSIEVLQPLLGSSADAVKRQVLQSLESRIAAVKPGSRLTQETCLSFMPTLINIGTTESDLVLRRTSLSCIDRIAELFGKKDPETVLAAAKHVSSASGLGATQPQLRHMALLCLTTFVEALTDSFVPIVPAALPQSLEILASALEDNSLDAATYNASYSFFGALLLYIPWMISSDYLDRLLQVSFMASGHELGSNEEDGRNSILDLVAKCVDSQQFFEAASRVWPDVRESGGEAIVEYLTMLQTSIERNTKATIVRHSQLLTTTFLEILDLRRIRHKLNANYTEGMLEEIETLTSRIMIQMIYKLNDTTFRPMFSRILDWTSVKTGKNTKKAMRNRQTSLCVFLHQLFDTLKSIVTSYSGYVLDSAVEILDSVPPMDAEFGPLWPRVMSVLQAAFENDHDEYWQSPTRLDTIGSPLLAQFKYCSESDEVAEKLTSTVIALGSAVSHSPEALKYINNGTLAHLRDPSPKVRLAAIRCELGLTEAIGEEWLAHLPEMLPYISEAMEDDDENIEEEIRAWIGKIESVLGESLDPMLQ